MCKCCSCNKETSDVQCFTTITLPLTGDAQSLLDLWQLHYIESETIPNFECPECKPIRPPVVKTHCISAVSLPSVIIFQFKRFSWSVQECRASKQRGHISFPSIIDASFLVNEESDVQYKLWAAIIHVGTSCAHGHYFALICDANDKWWKG